MRLLSYKLVITLCLCLAISPSMAIASGGGGHGGGEGASNEKKNEAKSKKEDAATITGGQGADDPIYLHLPVITLPIINDYGAQQIVTMLVDLHVPDKEKALKMQNHMPKLKDALLQALYGGLADGAMRNANALNIPKIKQSIKDTVNRVFGEGHVEDVLVQAVSQRKL